MDENTNQTTPETETTTAKKAIDFETMEALAPKLATKEYTQKEITKALVGGAITYASKEEVLALFEEKPAEENPSEESGS